MPLNIPLNIYLSIWFFDRPRRVLRCGYFLNIPFVMFCSTDVPDTKPIVLAVRLDALNWIASLCRMSMPIAFCERFFTSKMLQFLAEHDHDLRISSNTPIIWMSWLLKHFYFVFSVNVVIFVDGCFYAMLFVADFCMKDPGEPVSASQSSSMLPQFDLTQISPPVSFLRDTLFVSLNAVGLFVMTVAQSSIISYMYKAASASTSSSSSSSSFCSCSFLCRTRLVCG